MGTWQCSVYGTDGYSVYLQVIPDNDQIVGKTYMTRVEGEKALLSAAASQDAVLLQISGDAEALSRIITPLPALLRCSGSS